MTLKIPIINLLIYMNDSMACEGNQKVNIYDTDSKTCYDQIT